MAVLLTAGCTGTELTSKWQSYGNDNTRLDDWTGGDGAASVRLPDGRTLWFMNDAFLDQVNADGSRAGGALVAHNVAVVEQSDGILGPTLVGGAPPPGSNFRGSWLESPVPGTFYWILDGTVEGSSLRLLVSQSTTDGSTYHELVVTLSLPDLTVQGAPVLVPHYATAGVDSFLETPAYTYMYGTHWVEVSPGVSHPKTYVARVATGSVSQTSAWRYLTQAGWSADPTASPLVDIADVYQGTVVQAGSDYVLAGFATALDGDVVTARSTTPYGPFTTPTVAYEIPENGQPCGTSALVSYALRAHQEHGTWPTDAVFSYSITCWGDFGPLLTNVNNYRPRYIDLDLSGSAE